MNNKIGFSIIVFLVVFFSFAAMSETNVSIDEIGISFKVPDHIEWATKTEGNYEIMEETYHMDQKALIAFMLESDEYCKGVDPNSDIRFLLVSMSALPTEKNFAVMTDEEILTETTAALQGYEDVISVSEVYTTDNAKFAVVCSEMIKEQMFYLCQTCVNGRWYIFTIRGTNDGYKKTLAYYLMETTTFGDIDDTESAEHNMSPTTLLTSGATVFLPESWVPDINESIDPLVESKVFTKRGSDGLLRLITCSVVDFCEASGTNEAFRFVLSGDDYTQQLVINMASLNGIDPDSIFESTFNNKNYYGYTHDTNGISTIVVCILDNGYLYSFIFESFLPGNPYEDECYQVFENMLNTIEF